MNEEPKQDSASEGKNSKLKEADRRLLGCAFVYGQFIESSLSTAIFHRGLVILATDRGKQIHWLSGDDRKRFLQVAFHSHFIYRMSVFDSYLNSLTSFALSCKPEQSLRDKDIKITRLLAASRGELINEYIRKRTSEISRESFLVRIRELERMLPVDFEIDDNTISKLKEATRIRNRLVHEGSSYEFGVTDNLAIKFNIEKKPTPIPDIGVTPFRFIERLSIKIVKKIAIWSISELIGHEPATTIANEVFTDNEPRLDEHFDLQAVYDNLIDDDVVPNQEPTIALPPHDL